MATQKQGVKFEVSLVQKGFQKGLKKIQQSSKKLVSRLKSIWAPVNKFVFGPISAGVMGVIAGFRKFFGIIRQGAKNFIELQSRFSDINTLIDGPGGITDSTKKAIRQQSLLYGTRQADNAKAYYDIVSAGIMDQTEALRVLNVANKIAVAGNESVFATTKALISVMNAYSESNLSAAEAGDILQQVVKKGITTWTQLAGYISTVAGNAQVAGVSLNELALTISALTAKGLDMSRTMTGIKGIFNILLSEKGKEAQAVLKEYGISFDIATVRSKGFAQATLDVVTALKGQPEALKAVFREQEAFTGIALLTGESVRKLSKEFKNTKGALDDSLFDKLGDYEQHLKRLDAVIEDALMRESFAQMAISIKELQVSLLGLAPVAEKTFSVLSHLAKGFAYMHANITGDWTGIYDMQQALKQAEDPRGAITAYSKQLEKRKKDRKQIEKMVQKEEGKRAKAIESAHEKIAELTKKSVDTIVKGVEAIRQKTLDAIKQITQAFFGGGSFAGLAEVRKLLEGDDKAEDVYRRVRQVLPENVGGAGMAQVARVAKEISKTGEGLSEFLRLIEWVKKTNQALSVADVGGLWKFVESGGQVGGKWLNELNQGYKARVGAERAAGAQAEAEFKDKAYAEVQKESIQILKDVADKNADSAKLQAEATETMKKAVEDYQKAVDTPMTFDIILKDSYDNVIARKVAKQFEAQRRTRTAGPGITGP